MDQGARLVDKELALRTKEFAKVVAHKSPHMQALMQYILYSSFGKLIMKWHLRAVGILRIIKLFYISIMLVLQNISYNRKKFSLDWLITFLFTYFLV